MLSFILLLVVVSLLLLWLFIWFDFKSNFLVVSWILKSFFTLKCRTITKSSLMQLWSSLKLCQHAVNSIIKVQLQYSTAHQVAPANILGITALTHSLLGYINQWYSALSMVATKITCLEIDPKVYLGSRPLPAAIGYLAQSCLKLLNVIPFL